jgi:hypothetical protein
VHRHEAILDIDLRCDYSTQRQFLTELFRVDVKIEQRRFSIFTKTLSVMTFHFQRREFSSRRFSFAYDSTL